MDDLSEVSADVLLNITNWQQKYRIICSWGNLVKRKPTLRTDANMISGCETPAWMSYEVDTYGNVHFVFDSDSRIINGLAALVLSEINGRAKNFVASFDIDAFLLKVGLQKHLTPSRNNGLHAIVEQARFIATQSN